MTIDNHWAFHIVARPMAYADKSDQEVAGMVRMLMRDDLEHESICVAARDRIGKLSHDVATLQGNIESLCRDVREAAGLPLKPCNEVGLIHQIRNAVTSLQMTISSLERWKAEHIKATTETVADKSSAH